MASFLAKERSVAGPHYSRWLVPPAALAIHLCIGQAYAFSVFKTPLTQLIGVTKHIDGQDWADTDIFWIFSIAIAFLGLSAAVFGKWLENAGPRKAMFASACCFAGGFFISALGIKMHHLSLLYIGYGVVGGIGLGLGYISPVSTLVKWFVDRPGMATGLAIMGFGGGAMIASPLSVWLMNHFKSATSNGCTEAFVALGILYFVFMMFGVLTIRIPPADYKPAGYVPSTKSHGLITNRQIDVATASRTPQFYLLWLVLCLNVTAGIAILENASPLIQEMFKGKVTAASAAGFVGLLSLFNMLGRFIWSSCSDYIGRKPTYTIFFVLGAILYVGVTFTGATGANSVALFVACTVVMLSMYGGGFATIPAYIKDLFGTYNVSAIHGRILIAWSVAGVLGPYILNHMRDYELAHGVPRANVYSSILYVMAGLLVIGFICNLLVRPVSDTVVSSAEQKTPAQPAHA